MSQHNQSFGCYLIHFLRSIVEIQNQEFPAPLTLKAAFTSGSLVCRNYKRELRHIPQDCCCITFSKLSTWPHYKSAHKTGTQVGEHK
jgi:hypothetical protein